MAKYLILEDGSTWAVTNECVIYDSEKDKVYTIRTNRPKYLPGPLLTRTHYGKAIDAILDYEVEKLLRKGNENA